MEEYKILADVYDILNPKEEVFDQKPFFEELVKNMPLLKCSIAPAARLASFNVP